MFFFGVMITIVRRPPKGINSGSISTNHCRFGKGFYSAFLSLALGCATVLLPSEAEAVPPSPQLTTLENSGSGGVSIGGSNAYAFSFRLDNQDYALDSITAAIRYFPSAGDWILTAALYEASTTPGLSYGLPFGEALTTFSFGSFGSDFEVAYIDFTPGSSVILQANKAYSFALIAIDLNSPSATPTWQWMATTAAPAASSWEAVNFIGQSTDGGINFASFGSGNYLKTSVYATAVPEPSSIVFLAAGALAAGAYLRQRRSLRP